MAIQDRLFSLAAKVIRVISLKNVAIWTFAALVALIGYTIFENRTVIVNYIVNGPEGDTPQVTTFTMSDTSKARIKHLVDVDDAVIAITVLNADIRNNRRLPIQWYSDDASVQRQLETLFNGRYGGIPLFTSDEKNNESIVGVINGEFACSAYNEGGNASLFPGLGNRFPYVCRTSLPPYYGQFSGYITVSLNRVPTPQELDSIKGETLNISTEIYFRDVLPENRRLPK
jgi:hypothetical protein